MPYSLADVLPSVAASFGIAGPNPLDITPNRDVVVLLIDGLGAELLARHRTLAPTLAARTTATLTAGFPATTATSLTSLALGAPCATHGIIGYSFAIPDPNGLRLFNSLRWRLDGATGDDARESHPPSSIQPGTSRLEDLAAHGVDVHYVIPEYQRTSGLTGASFRAPGTLHPAATLAQVRTGIQEVAQHSGTGPRFAYAYFPELDGNGHQYGPDSPEALAVLREIDACVADLLTDLPPTCTLLITGDHGMIRADTTIDLDSRPDLHDGVRLIAGEARVRHIHLGDGTALADVHDRWTDALTGHAHVVTREQALDEHWFGPTPPTPVIERRIGDLLAVAEGGTVLVRPEHEPLESAMVGHHGARTPDERLIPLVTSP